MGSLAAITPAVTENIIDLAVYNSRVYALVSDPGTTYQKIYRLNMAEDDWETIATFPFYYLTNFIVYNNILFLYSWVGNPGTPNYLGTIYKLNGTYDGIDLVLNDPDRTSFYCLAEYNGRLYASSIDPNTLSSYLIRLNNTEDGWETIYDITSIGRISSMVVHNSRLCLFTANMSLYAFQLYKLNSTYDGIDFQCTFSNTLKESAYNNSISFNGSLYYIGNDNLIRVNAEETADSIIFVDPSYYTVNDLFIFRNYLHVADQSLNRLNAAGTGADNIIPTDNIRRRAVLNDKLFLTGSDGQLLYKYSSITSVSFLVSNAVGMVSSPINFYNNSKVDYPATYYWEFGDSNSDTAEEPVYSYSSAGTYDITLTVTCGYDIEFYTSVGYMTIYSYFHKFIYTIDDLQLIGSGPTWPAYGEYELANDIDASATTGWDDGFGNLGFLPIITTFRGILNGANFVISNLYMDNTSDASLFYTVEGASFRNLNFENISIKGSSSAATLFTQGTAVGPQYISNCNISGSFSGYLICTFSYSAYHYIFENCSSDPTYFGISSLYGGGLSGSSNGCDFINCTSTISSSLSNSSCVGLCMDSSPTPYKFSTISGCHTTINVTMASYAAGFSLNFEGVVTDSHVDGYIGTTQYAGGMVIWYNARGDSENLYTHCDVISDQNQTGGLMGVARANKSRITFRNCYTTGDVRSYFRVGGLVGESDIIDYEDCYATGDISLWLAGGLFGDIGDGTCTNCYSLGNVRGNRWGGGFAGGALSCTLINCYSLGVVTYGQLPGDYYEGDTIEGIGGFAGYLSNTNIENCFCTGNVSKHIGTVEAVANRIGGFSGEVYSGHCYRCFSIGNAIGNSYVGGFIGYYSPMSYFDDLSQCFSLGNATSVTGSHDSYIGGFVGSLENGNFSGVIKDCYSRGNVLSQSSGIVRYIGGFIGYCAVLYGYGYSLEVINCCSTGNVSDTELTPNNIGGFIGGTFIEVDTTLTVTHSYWDTDTSGQLISAGGEGRTTVAMKTAVNFIDWDFDLVWRMHEDITYPQFMVADFEADTLIGPPPLSINFSNLTSVWPGETAPIITRDWDFGDGSLHSSDLDPMHVYNLPGMYTVSLIETRNFIQDSVTKINYINVSGDPPTVDFIGSPLYGNPGLEVNFTDLSTGSITAREWDFGDGSPHSSSHNPTHVYSESGYYTVSLIVHVGLFSYSETKLDYVKIYDFNEEVPVDGTGFMRGKGPTLIFD